MKKFQKLWMIAMLALVVAACGGDSSGGGDGEGDGEGNNPPEFLPFTDPNNTEDWSYKESVSDEFEDDVLDEDKWLIQGKNGVYQSNFIGRAPSQFSTDNVRLEEGKLMLETRWEPDFPFSGTPQVYANGNVEEYQNITTAAVITKTTFLYGYMEIKCKAADASITSSFWTTGQGSELDVFEFVGKPKQTHKAWLEKDFKYSIHDWNPGAGGVRTWGGNYELPYKVADDFHVYGCDWSKDGLKFYQDGELIREATREEIEAEALASPSGEAWTLTTALRVWVDSETFPWHGVPVEEDLPVDYEIEYIRVWQRN